MKIGDLYKVGFEHNGILQYGIGYLCSTNEPDTSDLDEMYFTLATKDYSLTIRAKEALSTHNLTEDISKIENTEGCIRRTWEKAKMNEKMSSDYYDNIGSIPKTISNFSEIK